MREKMMKMLAKKRDLSPVERHAKMDVVKGLKDSVSEMMGHKLDGLKKVSVASDSSEGLQHGLEKAHEIVSGPEHAEMLKDAEDPYSEHSYSEGGEVDSDEESKDEESPAHEASESPEDEEEEHEGDEFEGLDMADIEQKLQHFLELKKRMESKKL